MFLAFSILATLSSVLKAEEIDRVTAEFPIDLYSEEFIEEYTPSITLGIGKEYQETIMVTPSSDSARMFKNLLLLPSGDCGILRRVVHQEDIAQFKSGRFIELKLSEPVETRVCITSNGRAPLDRILVNLDDDNGGVLAGLFFVNRPRFSGWKAAAYPLADPVPPAEIELRVLFEEWLNR